MQYPKKNWVIISIIWLYCCDLFSNMIIIFIVIRY